MKQIFMIEPDFIKKSFADYDEAQTDKGGQAEVHVMPENLRALERLTAKQALEIDDLEIKLADDEEKIKDVRRKLTNKEN